MLVILAHGVARVLLIFQDPNFAEGYWNVAQVKDGEYEISLYSKCKSSGMAFPPPGLDDYRSLVISGSIDRESPSKFGYTKPTTGVYALGDDIGVSFSEEINCKAPFTFTVEYSILNAANSPVVIVSPLNIVCDGYSISLAFSTSALVDCLNCFPLLWSCEHEYDLVFYY